MCVPIVARNHWDQEFLETSKKLSPYSEVNDGFYLSLKINKYQYQLIYWLKQSVKCIYVLCWCLVAPQSYKCVELIATITKGSVEKYLKLAKRLVEKYDVGEYQRGRIHALSDEIELVFGKSRGDQSLLSDYS